MASNGKFQGTIDAWAKNQKTVEDAMAAVQNARKGLSGYAKAIYAEMGSKPFTVKALGGRKYRAMFKKERTSEKTGKVIAEQYNVIPVPEFETEAEY